MGSFIDLTGEKYNKLTVLKRVKNQKKSTMWLCECDCGNKVIVSAGNLKNNHTTSCGCYAKQNSKSRMQNKQNPMYKHGLYNTRINEIWNAMKKRCYLKSHMAYSSYGGRGITICDEWLNRENGFVNFYNWAMDNGYQDNLSIDRINVDGNYEPNNCRWVTTEEQQNNKRNNRIIEYNGEKKTLAQWSKIYGINYKTLLSRIRSKKTTQELFAPVKNRR